MGATSGPSTRTDALRRDLGLATIVALFAIQVYSDLDSAGQRIAARVQEGMSPAYSAITTAAHSTTAIWLAVAVARVIVFTMMWRRTLREGRDLPEVCVRLPYEAQPPGDWPQ